MNYVIRDMISGERVGSVITSSPFVWPGTADECRTNITNGLEYKGGGDEVLQRVYRLDDLEPTGAGSVVELGEPVFDEDGSRYTRAVTKTKSSDDLYADQRAWVSNRRQAYRAAILALNDFERGDLIDGVGFVLDAALTMQVNIVQALVAANIPVTVDPKWQAQLQAVLAVKAQFPKP
jgi:hypothetical protein